MLARTHAAMDPAEKPTLQPNSDPLSSRVHLVAGRYALGREIGRGGAAIVYQAYDRETGGEVAVKMLRRELMDGVGIERFMREIRMAVELRHQNIVPLLDS